MTAAAPQNLAQRAAGFLGGYFAWLSETLASDTARRAVLADIGLDPTDPPALPIAKDRLDGIDRYRNQVNPDQKAFLAVWQDVLAVIEAIEGFVDAAGAGAGGKAIVKEAVRQLLGLTSTEYLRLRHPKTYFAARLLGVIEDRLPGAFHGPADVLVDRDIGSNLVRLIEAPLDHFDRIYSVPETEADARDLAANTFVPLAALLAFWEQSAGAALGWIGVEFELPERRVLHGWDTPDESPTPLADRLAEQMLSFSIRGLELGAVEGATGVTMAWVPREHGGPGLYVSLQGTADLDVPLGTAWKWNTRRPTANVLDALIWDSVDFLTGGPADPAIARSGVAASGDELAGEDVRLSFEPIEATAEKPYVLTVFGTRIEIGQMSISLRIARESDTVELKFLARHSALVLGAGDGDAFVGRVLPERGARLEFDLGVALTLVPELRVHLEGGSGLSATVPLNRSLGPARLQQLHLALASGSKTADRRLRFEASLAVAAELGPFAASVDRVGFELVVDTDGATTPHVGFKPPSGVGLVLDSEFVSGSGYLYHDAAKGQYAGVVEIEFRGLTLQAIGLITTRLPSGRPGFSLLVIVAASDFAPIDVGLGFRLVAVGGVVGYQRTVQIDHVRAGLKSGALDTILFPADPVRDAPRIISALETLMPPAAGQFLIGLMARFVWGVPTVLTIDLGLIVEAPSPTRLVVVGKCRSALPSEDAAVIRIQGDLLGVVDFDTGDIAVDAVLRDSRVAGHSVSGELALRARASGHRTLVLAVGGLHPKFTAPDGFPKLARVAIGLSKHGDTRLTLQAYLAITANTIQVGARLDFLFKAAGFSVEGNIGFDALFAISPFSFVVDIRAGVTLKWHGRTLLGVELELTLAGPRPWHAKGKATFRIWRFSKSVSFDRTIGSGAPPAELPAADPLPILIAALADHRNWSSELTGSAAMLVALRDRPVADDEVMVHPLGELTVRQRVVPLGIELDHFGATVPAGDRRFDISVAADDDQPAAATSSVEDYFAPAQFIAMTDTEKLTRPSFELMGAGVRIGATSLVWGGRDDAALIGDAEIGYETVVLGDGDERRERQAFAAAGDELQVVAELGAVARTPARHTGHARYQPPTVGPAVTVTRYEVVGTDDLAPVDRAEFGDPSSSYTAAAQALERYLARHPEERGQLRVLEANIR